MPQRRNVAIGIDKSILDETVFQSIDEKTRGNPELLKKEISHFCKPKKLSLSEFVKNMDNDYYQRFN